MIIADPIVVKILERALRRRLSQLEKCGEKIVVVGKHKVIVPQVHIQWIHNTNSVR